MGTIKMQHGRYIWRIAGAAHHLLRGSDMGTTKNDFAERILAARRGLYERVPELAALPVEAEGGCGVTGFCCSIPVSGKNIHTPSVQMHNRGNGKGGGIATVGLIPEQLGVSREVLDTHYLLTIAVLDPAAAGIIEKNFIFENFDVAYSRKLDTIGDWRDMKTLQVKPPDVYQYFARVKPRALDAFIAKHGLEDLDRGDVEDEFVSQNSIRINTAFYASLGEKQAFVMSHGRNMFILKIVGYAEEAVAYYKMENLMAHVWIAHQRYPTKGRVWHPAGAHPFMGMDEALVHNGDFANYFSVSEYLEQRNIKPLFLTDTEVSVLAFDLLNRIYRYPLEYIIESLAPTTEMDFDLLPPARRKIYRRIQQTQIHGSPDGPWFFIIARNIPRERKFQLLGITDTAMLRPQVFAIQDGEVQIGLICSEKQAIDATLKSLAEDDPRFCAVADKYWNARGGSCENGGAFSFTLTEDADRPGGMKLECADKFGAPIRVPENQKHLNYTSPIRNGNDGDVPANFIRERIAAGDAAGLASAAIEKMASCDYDTLRLFCREAAALAKEADSNKDTTIEALTILNDRVYPTGAKKRSSVLQIIRGALDGIFLSVSPIGDGGAARYKRIDLPARDRLRAPREGEKILVIDAAGFQPENDGRDSKIIVDAYRLGWKQFISFNVTGQRFHGVGLGRDTQGVRIDCYGSTGDYLASGMDGLEIHVHGDAQDQLGQILKCGKLVVHGSVGQTFMYGAKGGEVYIMRNAAGRPLINAVGTPRVVINGTCLDYLAESFMAGDPLNGGGFVVLNGLEFDDAGNPRPLERPYPGSNLFSLASGGAIYVRDPHASVVDEQLNGGAITKFTEADWALILPYLKENERLFGISIERDLLAVDGAPRSPLDVYRKVAAVRQEELAAAFSEDTD
jgi:glutamate synthase domain-containing protein 1/glutamate synthase domain-containing protein 3